MSDPHFERTTNRYAGDRLSSPPVIDGTPGGGTPWLLVALAAIAILAVVWLGVAPPSGNQETSATRPSLTTDIETTGRAAPRP